MQYAHRFTIDRPTVMPMEVSPKSFSRYFINVECKVGENKLYSSCTQNHEYYVRHQLNCGRRLEVWRYAHTSPFEGLLCHSSQQQEAFLTIGISLSSTPLVVLR
jgi:hypothetical protein